MLKTLTLPQLLATLTAVLTSIVFLILLFIFSFGHLPLQQLPIYIIAAIAFPLITFFTSKYLIESYISRTVRQLRNLVELSPQNFTSNSNFKLSNIDNFNEEVTKWAQQKEIEIKKLNKLGDYRRDFIGNVSHELKTPIFSIQGYLHTLAEGGLYDEKINVKYLKRAIINLERLEHIVEGLDTISNLESQKVKIKLEPFDIRELTNEVIEDLTFMASDKQIKILLNPNASKDFTVLGDSSSIRQVLNNLISNSIKYGKENGTTQIGFIDMVDNVLIEITDDGIGIDQEHITHLFDRFYRVDSGRGRKQGGSGLGLAIVKHILEAHNQTITVNSEIGTGSTFAFTLQKN